MKNSDWLYQMVQAANQQAAAACAELLHLALSLNIGVTIFPAVNHIT
jgi:hypothetical protein